MVAFSTSNGEEVFLNALKKTEEGIEPALYDLKDDQGRTWMELRLDGNKFQILTQLPDIDENQESLLEKLDYLVLLVIEAAQSGIDETDVNTPIEEDPYDPETIKVQTKPFNLTLISSMIDKGYIDLAPDFQRNFVWDSFQKSRLIESILLRIPLPMFYFSEDEEGNISVVDGLQRLTTIKEFMDNKFSLKGLEYLAKTCDGRYYSDIAKGQVLDAKYLKWFDMTQLTVNVIDPSSPPKVKYDIFRRINTGGKPLNNQEIRNCLASRSLRAILKSMTALPEFKVATDWSIKSTRMEDIEVALRFICFHRLYNEDRQLNNYNGNMELILDNFTERLGKYKNEDLEEYIVLFSNAMKNAAHLFGGRYAFRKIMPWHLEPGKSKQLINKALFLSWSVLLSNYSPKQIEESNTAGILAQPLAQRISDDKILFNFLSYGTNGKANLQYAFSSAKEILDINLQF